MRQLILGIAGAVVATTAVSAQEPPPTAGRGTAPLLAFVTSVQGTGDLSTWPDAQGLTGLEAADEICRQRALAASLPEPSEFVAYLSDDTTDAACRMIGSAVPTLPCGTRSGEADPRRESEDGAHRGMLAANAGPWVRTDGRPFLPTLDDALAPTSASYMPVRLDEFGNPVPADLIDPDSYFTATSVNGARFGDTCDNWTGEVGQPSVGIATGVGIAWYSGSTTPCSAPTRLLCMQRGLGGALPAWELPGRLAFLSSSFTNGDLGAHGFADGATGIEAGDNICQANAASAGLPFADTFKAWLSDGVSDAIDRFEHDGPIKRPDGIRIADDLADLGDGALDSGIGQAANGTYRTNQGVWTGTDSDGASAAENCLGWTNGSSGFFGRQGGNRFAEASWTDWFDNTCSFSSFLYCIADRPLDEIFVDRFEFGDLSGWSEVKQ